MLAGRDVRRVQPGWPLSSVSARKFDSHARRMIMRFVLIALLAVSAFGQPARRALLIGIDDYTASALPVVKTIEHRGWPDLQGSANDVRILSEMLVLRYGL